MVINHLLTGMILHRFPPKKKPDSLPIIRSEGGGPDWGRSSKARPWEVQLAAEGPHCQKWSGESGSSPSSPSKSHGTICIRSPPGSHLSPSEPFPRGSRCWGPSRIPSAPKRHGGQVQGSSSSCSPCPKLTLHCERIWEAFWLPHSSSHHLPPPNSKGPWSGCLQSSPPNSGAVSSGLHQK